MSHLETQAGDFPSPDYGDVLDPKLPKGFVVLGSPASDSILEGYGSLWK